MSAAKLTLFFITLLISGCSENSNPVQRSEPGQESSSSGPDAEAKERDSKTQEQNAQRGNRRAPLPDRIKKTKSYGFTELAISLKGSPKAKDFVSESAVIYTYNTNIPPNETDWNALEIVIVVASRPFKEANPLGGFWNRGKMGYGGSVIEIALDEETYELEAEFTSEERQGLIYERMSCGISQRIANSILSSNKINLSASSRDFSIEIIVDNEDLKSIRELIHYISN